MSEIGFILFLLKTLLLSRSFCISVLTPAYTKDRYASGDSVTIEVIAASDNYSNSVDVIEAARKALEGKRGKYDDFKVTGAKLIAADEDFIEETFIQRLTFEIETDSVE